MVPSTRRRPARRRRGRRRTAGRTRRSAPAACSSDTSGRTARAATRAAGSAGARSRRARPPAVRHAAPPSRTGSRSARTRPGRPRPAPQGTARRVTRAGGFGRGALRGGGGARRAPRRRAWRRGGPIVAHRCDRYDRRTPLRRCRSPRPPATARERRFRSWLTDRTRWIPTAAERRSPAATVALSHCDRVCDRGPVGCAGLPAFAVSRGVPPCPAWAGDFASFCGRLRGSVLARLSV